MHDLVITGGTVVDGTGAPARTADVAIDGDRIVAVGTVDGAARRTIDAAGAIVTPGFVDIHTHYDGQATWEDCLAPSAWHGVTTVVMGNCGVGFAPVRPHRSRTADRADGGRRGHPRRRAARGSAVGLGELPRLPRRARPAAARHRHRRAAAARRAPPVRDGRARRRRATAATPDEIAEMGRLARQAVQAGALGLHHVAHAATTAPAVASTRPRSPPPPTSWPASPPRSALAGVLQVVSDFADLADETAHRAGDGRGVRAAAVDLGGAGRCTAGAVARAAGRDRRGQRRRAVGHRAGGGTRRRGCCSGLQATVEPDGCVGHRPRRWRRDRSPSAWPNCVAATCVPP